MSKSRCARHLSRASNLWTPKEIEEHRPGRNAAAKLRSVSGGRGRSWPGTLGNVRMVRSWWLNNCLGGTKAKKLDGPLDWEQWQGPMQSVCHSIRSSATGEVFRLCGRHRGGSGRARLRWIHLLMNASYPTAVTASAEKPHRQGFDTPESAVVTAEYPEDFIATSSQLRSHALQEPQRPVEPTRWRQGPDGHRARGLQVYTQEPKTLRHQNEVRNVASGMRRICTYRISSSAFVPARRRPRPCGSAFRRRWWYRWPTCRFGTARVCGGMTRSRRWKYSRGFRCARFHDANSWPLPPRRLH